MWILQWIPDWLFLLVMLIGFGAYIATYLLKFIPFVYMYKIPIQIASFVLVSIGAFMTGMMANEAIWQARVKELEAKVAESEQKAKEKNVEIVEKVVYKDKIVKEKGDEIVKYIDREVVKKEEIIKYIESCPVPKEIIDAHNAAATLNRKEK